MSETIEVAPLPDATRERYLRYALSVITARALPDVRDGLKPVQRRILYTMEAVLGLGGGDAKLSKCASVVGRVMGDFHPHGDVAIYEALVRMAQEFSLRYPLVDGQGNFGTIHGDPPAAFRYTECRLRATASELMALLGEETVPFRPNYDGRFDEPVVLPVPAPFLLANGCTGIAVGMATNIPPHNLAEVARAAVRLVDERDAAVAQLMKDLRGPDFPTGGEVLTKRDELRKIYETGRGSFKIRGTYKVEEGARGRRFFVITSIPYGTTIEALNLAIEDIIAKKKIPHALDVRDETTEQEGLRIVVEMKKDADPAELAAYLYRHTPLQVNYGVNMTCLVPTENPLVGRPAVLDLKTMLRHFLDFRFDVVTRSLRYRLRKLEERIHVLRGFMAIYEALDEAVKLIRKSEDKADAQSKLMKRFRLDEVQTDAILELRLYKLARIEVEDVTKDLAEKRAEAKRIATLLKGTAPRWNLVRGELVAFGEKHADKRRTRVLFSDDAEHVYDADVYIAKEDTNLIVTRLGIVKRVRGLVDPAATRVREGDEVGWILQGSTRAEGAFFSNRGAAYVSKLVDAPATTGYGDPIQKLFKFGDGERIVGAISLDPRLVPPDPPPRKGREGRGALLLVATAAGNVLRVPLEPHRTVSTRAGRRFARPGEGDEVVSVELVPAKARTVLLATRLGYAHRFPIDEVPLVVGAGKGLRGIKLEGGDRVLAATARPSMVLLTTRGAREVLEQKAFVAGARGEPGAVAKQRGGFERAVSGEIELEELEPEQERRPGAES